MQVKPLIFKTFEDCNAYFTIHYKESRLNSSYLAIAGSKDFDLGLKMSARLIVINAKPYSKILQCDWEYDILYLHSNAGITSETYFVRNIRENKEIFFERLKKSYPDYFTWLLFNPDWYFLLDKNNV